MQWESDKSYMINHVVYFGLKSNFMIYINVISISFSEAYDYCF